MVNMGLIVLYTVLTSFVFKPWWVGFTIGMWVAVIELTIVLFIKYYQTYYQVSCMPIHLTPLGQLFHSVHSLGKSLLLCGMDCHHGNLCLR
jgi:hypothetical protein